MDNKQTHFMPAEEYRDIRQKNAEMLHDIRVELAVLANAAVTPASQVTMDTPAVPATIDKLRIYDQEKHGKVPKRLLLPSKLRKLL
jgi:hypothetical protein